MIMEDIFLELKDARVSDDDLRKFGCLDFLHDICWKAFLVPKSVPISKTVEVTCHYLCSSFSQNTSL